MKKTLFQNQFILHIDFDFFDIQKETFFLIVLPIRNLMEMQENTTIILNFKSIQNFILLISQTFYMTHSLFFNRRPIYQINLKSCFE